MSKTVRLFISVIVITSNSFCLSAQQRISAEFTKPLLKDDFNEENKNWEYQTNYDNLFVLDRGDFFLNRINTQSPYALLTTWPNDLQRFQIKSAMKLAPDQGKEQTIGLIFLVQPDGKGAVVIEFNREKEYRIKQLVGQFYKYITGDKATQGWVKNSAINTRDDYNELDVRVFDNQIDFYINRKFMTAFTTIDYKAGGMGILIGPDTKAKIDYFNVYGTEEENDSLQNINGEFTKKLKGDDLIAKLESDLEKLRLQIDESRLKLQADRTEHEAAVSSFKRQLETCTQRSDSMEIRLRSLSYLEDEMLKGISQDLLLTLTTELREQINLNNRLDAELGYYKDSLFFMHKNYRDLKQKLLTQVIEKRSTELKAKSNKATTTDSKEMVSTTKPSTTVEEKTTKDGSKTDLPKPNPRSKQNEAEAKAAESKDTLPTPKPIRSRVKTARKANRSN